MENRIIIVGHAGSDEVKKAIDNLAKTSPHAKVMVVDTLKEVIDFALGPELIDESLFVPSIELQAMIENRPAPVDVDITVDTEVNYRSQPYRRKFFKKR